MVKTNNRTYGVLRSRKSMKDKQWSPKHFISNQ